MANRGQERTDLPIICETCLGDNPYVRMTKANYRNECKICSRPFTVFRWRPGRDARFKKTEICQTCSTLKNACQVCIFDLQYGLPIQVIDTTLGINFSGSYPKSDVNREFFAEEHDRRARAGMDYESSYGKMKPNDTILKLQRTTPYYNRNLPHACTFNMRGKCNRGAACPYRHEMHVGGELSQQNIKDRFYGVNDPVAMKMLNMAGKMPSLEPPDDQRIRTHCVGRLDGGINDQETGYYPSMINEQETGYYPSMDPQRMGAVNPFQGGSSRGSNVNMTGLEKQRSIINLPRSHSGL
ncbi:zinc finger CCCH domain-containing protein 4-like [Apium graveolens]|uniref:zinc finger CCCH domain-containing protein 4-like n=1 Tax=Apium graveolens TaxID=4045 RepID=UPI003D78C809